MKYRIPATLRMFGAGLIGLSMMTTAQALDLKVGDCIPAGGMLSVNADATVVDCDSDEARSRIMDIIPAGVEHGFTQCVAKGYGHLSEIGPDNPVYCVEKIKKDKPDDSDDAESVEEESSEDKES